MVDNFYARWFSRTQPEPMSEKEQWQRHTNWLINLSKSPWAEAIKQKFDVPAVNEAEDAFQVTLQEIKDPELRNRIDMAAGKISQAYETLGFCMGHFSQDSRAAYL